MGSYRVEECYHDQANLLTASQGLCSQWFGVRTRSNYEKITSAALRYKGYEEFLPLCTDRRIWSDRIRVVETPVFPGYVFCRFDPSRRLPILTTPGVVGIVGFGEAPAPICEHEINSLRTIINAGLSCEPWPFLEAGQPVRIEYGPLAGFEGTVLQVRGQYRVIVQISMLKRSISAEVDRETIRPITGAIAVSSKREGDASQSG
jgi:transcription antitermination factor NusG